jgi:hypothetical protein
LQGDRLTPESLHQYLTNPSILSPINTSPYLPPPPPITSSQNTPQPQITSEPRQELSFLSKSINAFSNLFSTAHSAPSLPLPQHTNPTQLAQPSPEIRSRTLLNTYADGRVTSVSTSTFPSLQSTLHENSQATLAHLNNIQTHYPQDTVHNQELTVKNPLAHKENETPQSMAQNVMDMVKMFPFMNRRFT